MENQLQKLIMKNANEALELTLRTYSESVIFLEEMLQCIDAELQKAIEVRTRAHQAMLQKADNYLYSLYFTRDLEVKNLQNTQRELVQAKTELLIFTEYHDAMTYWTWQESTTGDYYVTIEIIFGQITVDIAHWQAYESAIANYYIKDGTSTPLKDGTLTPLQVTILHLGIGNNELIFLIF